MQCDEKQRLALVPAISTRVPMDRVMVKMIVVAVWLSLVILQVVVSV